MSEQHLSMDSPTTSNCGTFYLDNLSFEKQTKTDVNFLSSFLYDESKNMAIPPLSPELQERARVELNEIPSEVHDYVNNIKKWIEDQQFPFARTDDLWLVNFLRGCKFNVPKTKEKLEYFYKSRQMYPVLFSNRDPLQLDIQELLKSTLFLPIELNEYCSVIVRWKDISSRKLPFPLLCKVGLMLLELYVKENYHCMISGFHIIVDYRGFSYGYLSQLSPDLFKKFIYTLQYGYPLRLRGIHLINLPYALEFLFKLVTPIITKFLVKIHLYNEKDSFKVFELFPKQMVPLEYGGEGKSIKDIAAFHKEKMENCRDWFLEESEVSLNNETHGKKRRDIKH